MPLPFDVKMLLMFVCICASNLFVFVSILLMYVNQLKIVYSIYYRFQTSRKRTF
jgi:hypothetical protein